MVGHTIVFATALVMVLSSQVVADGVIEGVVQNATQRNADTAGVNVVLRAQIDGQLAIVAQTVADVGGRFRFTGLPLREDVVYLPGANKDDVHFPGPRIRLQPGQPTAAALISIYDSSSTPCPLIVDEHAVTLRSEPGLITVRETLHINNPSSTCYVGTPGHEGAFPVTLQLGIPKEFERVTFDKEAWGRQFHLINDQLVTSLPWPPGTRELSFTYVIRPAERTETWRRQLSLPCRKLRLTVESSQAHDTRCNLPRRTSDAHEQVRYESGEQPLSAGFVVDLQLNEQPISVVTHARRGAVLLSVGLGIVAGWVALRNRSERKHAVSSEPASGT